MNTSVLAHPAEDHCQQQQQQRQRCKDQMHETDLSVVYPSATAHQCINNTQLLLLLPLPLSLIRLIHPTHMPLVHTLLAASAAQLLLGAASSSPLAAALLAAARAMKAAWPAATLPSWPPHAFSADACRAAVTQKAAVIIASRTAATKDG
jgi:hypothetical protein